jgi:GMP synthase-like glutamine amidotransferase
VIVYVDLEHPRLQQDAAAWEKHLARRLKHKYRFEDLSGEPCLIVRYPRLSPALLRQVQARAVLVSGCATDFEHYAEEDLAGLRAVYCDAGWPTLGLCAGHQLMAQVYGGRIGAMGPWAGAGPSGPRPAGADANPFPGGGYRPGDKEEHGFKPVRVLRPHPLFAGFGDELTVYESHYWEVKSLPEGFEAAAATDLCPIQAVAHSSKPLFGVQFHAEEYDDEHPDGRQLIANFFKLAGIGA